MNTPNQTYWGKTRIRFSFFSVVVSSLLSLLIFSGQVDAETFQNNENLDLTTFNLEDLMEMTVTSVSKKSQRIGDAAAAIYVISQDDIKRSGVTTIADALRMVPGVQVAKIDSNKWAISARGFNGRFANKLLVLMDGRSLYTPFFIGVYWEVQDTMLEDIERIEVIRGPGGSLWGSNAVNGVINIITKSADKTKGAVVTAGAGSYENGFASGRYGASIGDSSNIRMYAKHRGKDSFETASGDSGNDSWQTSQGGFRFDSEISSKDQLTLQGDYYSGSLNETYQLYHLPTSSDPSYLEIKRHASSVSGGNILTRWQHTISENDSISMQLYYDHTERDMLVSPQKFNTVDLDLQHTLKIGSFNDLVYGFGYRYSQYEVKNSSTLSFDQQNVSNNLFSSFIHDQITVLPASLALILGVRLENNDYSGFDFQPNARLLWTPTPTTSVWGGVSRAVRSSTKGEEDIRYNYRTIPPNTNINSLPIPLRLEIVGNKNFKSEEVLAYEIGYRSQLLPQLSFDVATFYNVYKNLRVISPLTPYTEPTSGTPSNAVQTFQLSNDMHGHSIGVEISTEWSPKPWWRVHGSYSYQNLSMTLDGTSSDTINKGNAEGDVPLHQFSLRSGFDITRDISLDLWLRGADRLESIDGSPIPAYLTMDTRVGWKPTKNLEFYIVGQNLLESRHREFTPEYINTTPSETVRSVYGAVTWRY